MDMCGEEVENMRLRRRRRSRRSRRRRRRSRRSRRSRSRTLKVAGVCAVPCKAQPLHWGPVEIANPGRLNIFVQQPDSSTARKRRLS